MEHLSVLRRFLDHVAPPSSQQRFGFQSYAQTIDTSHVSLHEHSIVHSPIVTLRNSVVDRAYVEIRAGGREMPPSAADERGDYAIFKKGALQLPHPGPLNPSRFGGYQQRFISSADSIHRRPELGKEPMTTFVIERQEYVNLYHTLIEIFNAYVAIQLIARDEPYHLLFLDGHCRGALDSLWAEILKPSRIQRLQDYPHNATCFRKLVLVPGGYDSPLYNTGRIRPYPHRDLLSDFVDAVLTAYEITDSPTQDRILTFVDRRDYRPHPHSDGIVDRKVDDLDQTTHLLKQLYPQHRVDVHSFENMPFGQQLQIVRKSDVLCGVHGAALVHTLFMRPHTELVEFRPPKFRRNRIFENLAKLRSIHYRSYVAATKPTLPGGKLVVELTTKRN